MSYKLKPACPDFTVVDGEFAGRTYKAGEVYEEIPLQYENRFESLEPFKPFEPFKEEQS